MHCWPLTPPLTPQWLLFTQYLLSVMYASLVQLRPVADPPQLTLFGSTQPPDRHWLLPLHTVVQLPQWLRSVFGSTHVPEQAMPLFGHTQLPFVHVAPVAQRLPHVPQLASSLSTSWQAPPLQDACPTRQRHMLEAQV